MTAKHLSDGNDDGTIMGQNAADRIAFHGGTPTAQPPAIADPVDAATTQAAVITLLGILRANGFIAT